MANEQEDGLLALVNQLPEEVAEEGSTGRDLINNIILEAKKQERDKIRQELTKIDAIEDYVDRQKALVSFIYTLKGGTE